MSEKRPRGRPRKDVQRNNFTFRMREDMKAKVAAEADSLGVTMAEIVERAVFAHFDQPALIDALADRLEARIRKTKPVVSQEGGETIAYTIRIPTSRNTPTERFVAGMPEAEYRAKVYDAIFGDED